MFVYVFPADYIVGLVPESEARVVVSDRPFFLVLLVDGIDEVKFVFFRIFFPIGVVVLV